MNREDLIHYIHSTENINLVSENEILLGSEINEFFCELKINESKVSVRVLINNRFPEILPKFYLEKYNSLGFIPHVEPDGSICYLEKESIYVNTDVNGCMYVFAFETRSFLGASMFGCCLQKCVYALGTDLSQRKG